MNSLKFQKPGQPEAKKVEYKLNSDTGYYERIAAPPGFEKMPLELKVEDTRQRQQIHADVICRGRVKEGSYTFFTGLRSAGSSPGIYYGDHFHPTEKKKNSFALFIFSPGNEYLTVFYFNHVKVYPKQRGRFAIEFLLKNPVR